MAVQSYASTTTPEAMTNESKRHRQDWSKFASHVHPVDDVTDEWLAVYHIMHCWTQKGHAKAQTVSYALISCHLLIVHSADDTFRREER